MKGAGSGGASPGFDGFNEEAASAGAAMLRRDPHADELGVLRGLLFEEGSGEAAVLIQIVCEVADGAWGVEIGGALLPVGVGELRLAGVGAAEGAGCVQQSAETDCLVIGGQRRSDLVERDHGDECSDLGGMSDWGLMGSGGGFAGFYFFEEPDDADAEEAEEGEPAEDVDEGPVGGLALEFHVEAGLGGVERRWSCRSSR